jgi:hypothetical protein
LTLYSAPVPELIVVGVISTPRNRERFDDHTVHPTRTSMSPHLS